MEIPETELNLLAHQIALFTKQLQKKLNKRDGNIIFSPVNIHAFLVILSQDPWFFSKSCFRQFFFVDAGLASRQYKNIFSILDSTNNLIYKSSFFLNQHNVLQNTFKNLVEEYFTSQIILQDLTKLEDASKEINSWMNVNTAQKVENICEINDDINLVHLSAMHYKNNWAEPFSVDQTMPGAFYVDSQNTIEVHLMKKKGQFFYKNDTYFGVKILKLPFVDSSMSLIIVLPNTEHAKTSLKQEDFDDIGRLMENMTLQEVDVSLPKFKMNDVLDLVPFLRERTARKALASRVLKTADGVEDLFSANFLGMIEGSELNLKDVRQQVFLEVNEEGLETATGTIATLIKARDEQEMSEDGLAIYEADMTCNISNRFAKTKVTWRVKNNNKVASNAEFKVVLSEMAFITEFVMEIDGKSYKSYIKEKEEAKNIYNVAVAHGQSAGLVEAKTRDSKEFGVSVNLEPDAIAVFMLTYEEMLQRIHDQYELVLNIDLNQQIVNDLNVKVYINESRPLKFVKTPPLRSGNDIGPMQYDKYLDPLSDINMINSRTATVKFRPNAALQKKMGHFLNEQKCKGLSGQFVVQYDVEREPLNGEVLLQDGYFAHFFAANDLDPLSKHVIFVLDTSGSMQGRKLEQLKDAMTNILDDLRKDDMLSIIEFNSEIAVWDVNSKKISLLSENVIKDFRNPFTYLQRYIVADPVQVNESIIKKSKEVVQDIVANGMTFMIGGLETALYLVKRGQELNEDKDEKLQPIIIFLTDGAPNIGIHSTEEIVKLVTDLNRSSNVPIFSLSFGTSADREFLRKLSLKNLGFSRHIYEAADASLQLQDFYKSISSPLLHDINFKYDGEVEQLTRTWFPIYFRGSELVVAGRCGCTMFPTTISSWGPHGLISVTSAVEKPVTSLERLWAYLTVKQLLNDRESAANPADLTRQAVTLAFKYSFVTDVTSLVVVKPTESTTVHNDSSKIGSMNAGSHLRNKVLASASPQSFGSPQAMCFGGPPPPPPPRAQAVPFAQPLRAPAAHLGSSQAHAATFGFGSSQALATTFGSSQAPTATFGFGTSQAPATTFGSSQAPAATFGSSHQTPATTFGSSQAPAATFGSSQTPSATFGTSQGLFGAPSGGGFQPYAAYPPSFGYSQENQPEQWRRAHNDAFINFSQSNQGSTEQQGFASSNVNAFGDTALNFGNAQTSVSGFGNSQGDGSFTFGLKSSEEFIVNRPFLVMLQLEKDDTTLILFRGRVVRPCG